MRTSNRNYLHFGNTDYFAVVHLKRAKSHNILKKRVLSFVAIPQLCSTQKFSRSSYSHTFNTLTSAWQICVKNVYQTNKNQILVILCSRAVRLLKQWWARTVSYPILTTSFQLDFHSWSHCWWIWVHKLASIWSHIFAQPDPFISSWCWQWTRGKLQKQ